MKGLNIKVKTCIGRATHRAVFSVYSSAIDFGISSPNTTWKNVINANAIDTDIVWVAMFWLIPGKNAKIGSMIWAKVPSPTQPRPILDIVTPSCTAAMNLSKSFNASKAIDAL